MMSRLIDTRIRPPAAAMSRRLAQRAAKLAVDAMQARQDQFIARAPRALWPDMFED